MARSYTGARHPDKCGPPRAERAIGRGKRATGMLVRVRVFANVREITGGDPEIGFDAAEVRIAELRDRLAREYPALAELLPVLAVAVNQEYVQDPDAVITAGDEVALIQPIAGGAGAPQTAGEAPFALREQPLDPMALRDLVLTAASGAVVLFEGTVRDHHEGREVVRLEYEAYAAMVERQLAIVGEEIAAAFPGVHRVAIHHRSGMLDIGDTAVVVAVSAAHRGEAFAAAERAMDRVKQTVPVWKREWGPDGAMWQEGISPQPEA